MACWPKSVADRVINAIFGGQDILHFWLFKTQRE